MIQSVLENRYVLGAIVVAGVPAVIGGYILLVERALRRVGAGTAGRIRPWLWVLPALAFVSVFLVYPAVATLVRSFRDRADHGFVGLENYRWFFTDEDSLIALRNNAIWAVVLPLVVVGLGLLLAVFADRVRYEVVVRTIVFLPMAISAVAAGVIWRLMYDVDPDVGTLNAALGASDGSPVPWLSSQPLNNLMLVVVGIWMMAGLAVVVLSAALKDVPAELVEAARLDGANEFQVFRHVMYPQLRPTVGVVATTLIIFALKTFDVVYVMTNGNFGTEVVANELYKQLFSYGRQERAATLAIVLFLATIPVMAVNIRRFRQQEEN